MTVLCTFHVPFTLEKETKLIPCVTSRSVTISYLHLYIERNLLILFKRAESVFLAVILAWHHPSRLWWWKASNMATWRTHRWRGIRETTDHNSVVDVIIKTLCKQIFQLQAMCNMFWFIFYCFTQTKDFQNQIPQHTQSKQIVMLAGGVLLLLCLYLVCVSGNGTK